MSQGGRQNYELVSKLGKGAGGTVYKAIRKSDNKTIALKIIDALPDSTSYKNAIQEIKVLKEIAGPNCHPNLACYYDHSYDPVKGEIYIEMEFIDGETLFDFAKKYRDEHPMKNYLLYKYLLLILKDILKGLLYIHDKNVLHNDIKPENIMIDKNLVPKLVDFGLSCDAHICKMGTLCCSGFSGTPDFASPEMYSNEVRYPASDIWSLGVTLYVMALGKYPFDYGNEPTIQDIMLTVRDENPEKLNTNNQFLNYIVNNSLIKIPEDRITARQMDELLKNYK